MNLYTKVDELEQRLADSYERIEKILQVRATQEELYQRYLYEFYQVSEIANQSITLLKSLRSIEMVQDICKNLL